MAKERDCHTSNSAATAKKIVLAEDDPDIRFILNLALNDAGYEVEALPDGNSIVEEGRESPDLYILDKALPTIDGLAICKYLKINKKTRDVPIIMISCYHELKRIAKKYGVDDFIEKPFDLNLLLQKVHRNITNHGKKKQNRGV
jgi:DNA-binding response OmpR family regulator